MPRSSSSSAWQRSRCRAEGQRHIRLVNKPSAGPNHLRRPPSPRRPGCFCFALVSRPRVEPARRTPGYSTRETFMDRPKLARPNGSTPSTEVVSRANLAPSSATGRVPCPDPSHQRGAWARHVIDTDPVLTPRPCARSTFRPGRLPSRPCRPQGRRLFLNDYQSTTAPSSTTNPSS